jgi:tRNA modification GTPase
MASVRDTIFAVSSGAPPAAIGIIRISGPQALAALETIAGAVPKPRHATLARLRRADGVVLDEALVLSFPGPHSATGEDCAELHCHGGRAVLGAVTEALSQIAGLRAAEPGEFTRRAFANGRIDLAEAEGLADLLAAETELQRAAALANASGALSARLEEWRVQILALSAIVEGALDFSDEEDSAALPPAFADKLAAVVRELEDFLAEPRAEALREGFRVVLAGPPNAGKSSLFNALIGKEAAITAPTAGTTRDLLEQSVAIMGIPFTFVDTAGLRELAGEAIEAEGIARAERALGKADLVLWLGPEGEGPDGAWEITARCDAPDAYAKSDCALPVSVVTAHGVRELRDRLVHHARAAMPRPGAVAVNARQAALLEQVLMCCHAAKDKSDLLISAEELRGARSALDRLTGRATTEDMLDALFGRFCIGK